jgi:serine protease AprX
MKKVLVLVCILVFAISARSQFSKYVVVLKDKNNNPYNLNNPSAFLSGKSIARRTRQNIALDSTDLPIVPAYLDSIAASGTVSILNKSKWLNQVLIQSTDAAALAKIQSFPFVKFITGIAPRVAANAVSNRDKFNEQVTGITGTKGGQGTNDFFNYGNMYPQIHIHEGEYLHNNGFRGEGMTIAILDGGFFHYDTNPALDSVRLQNRVLGTWDFVMNESSVTEDNIHGMYCFSIIASNVPGSLVGTCPKANFYLFRTEDVATEYPVEEQNWVAAAEVADSLGVDLITSSLGYSEFDNPGFNHTYADLNGKNTIVTRGADLAVQKGMIVTNSAGNSGNTAWHYIIAPADGDSVLAVGAVNSSGQIATFSSYGPSYDGRIKPNVASVGWGTVIAGASGNPASGSGTSFSNPNLAGLVTCLWQAFPDFSNMEILDAVQKSSSQYASPDDRIGYGIPNMRVAYDLLVAKRVIRNANNVLANDWLKTYPIPFTNAFTVLLKGQVTGKATLVLYDAGGRQLTMKTQDTETDQLYFISFSQLQSLPAGVYLLKYSDAKTKRTIKILK